MREIKKELWKQHISDILVLVLVLIGLVIFLGMALDSKAAPVEVWLTPDRAAALKRVAQRPYITGKQQQKNGTIIYTWTNGESTYTTTQQVTKVTGKAAKSAWTEKLKAKDAERELLLNDIKAIKAKPTAKALESLIKKHEGGKKQGGKNDLISVE